MIVDFNPHELLHTFEVLTKNQMTFPEDDDVLLNKFRTGILIALSKVHEEDKAASFKAWEEAQASKIKDLEKQNEEVIKEAAKASPSKK